MICLNVFLDIKKKKSNNETQNDMVHFTNFSAYTVIIYSN